MNKQTEALKMAASVISSINEGKQHLIITDDDRGFFQREEWVRWAIDEVLPQIKEALEQPANKNIRDSFNEMLAEKVDMQRRLRELPIGIDAFPEQPAQEPVVLNETILTAPKKIYLMVGDEYENNEPFPDNSIDVCWSTGKDFDNDVPYIRADLTHPAPSWQGLTSEEIRSLDLDNDVISVIFQTEKLLKEKNHGN